MVQDKQICRPLLNDVYDKLKEYNKIEKVRWYREEHVNLELTNLSIDNIIPSKIKNLIFGLAFKVENNSTKFWIEIANTDMVDITYGDMNPNGQDIIIKINDGSRICIWKNFH